MIEFVLFNIILKLIQEIKDEDTVNMNPKTHGININFVRLQKEGDWE